MQHVFCLIFSQSSPLFLSLQNKIFLHQNNQQDWEYKNVGIKNNNQNLLLAK